MRHAAIILMTAALQGAAVCASAGDLKDLPPGCDANTYEIVQCQIRELAKLEARLDKAYGVAFDAAEPAQRPVLKSSQTQWRKFRATNCNYYRKASGTIASVRAGYCMLDLTRARAKELEDAIKP